MSYLLPRIVGTSVASEWMLTGRTVDADEASARSLVSELVDDDRLLERRSTSRPRSPRTRRSACS